MTANAIEAVGLSKRFTVPTERRTSLKERFVRGKAPKPREFWALKDATFAVPKGSSLGLIGQNGSGKSTALKVLTGIYRPTSGRVTVNGSVSALLEVGAGFHPELTGRENIRLNATILGFTNREIDRLMDSIIEFADIGDHIDAPIKHYSSGMYVRLGFAVAVMVRPEILLVDEVIAVGDEEFQRKCYSHLNDLRQAGTSMIIVSHGLTQITDLCDGAVWLQDGQVEGIGQSRDVVRSYLDSVNAREIVVAQGKLELVEDKPATAGVVYLTDEQLPVRPLRRGSGQMWVTGIECLDAEGQVQGVLVSGRDATFRVHYRAETDVERVVIGVGFVDAHERIVSWVNSEHVGPWEVPRGMGFVDFSTSPLLLAGGTYQIFARVRVGGDVIDEVEVGVALVVRAPEVAMLGSYLQPGEWELNVREVRLT